LEALSPLIDMDLMHITVKIYSSFKPVMLAITLTRVNMVLIDEYKQRSKMKQQAAVKSVM
jgi:hypothetical protein